jgi:cytochrome b subunit of formate dehydrogenase
MRPAHIALSIFFAGLLAAGAHAEGDADCLECHSDVEKLAETAKKPAQLVARRAIRADVYGRTKHATKGCAECHSGFDSFPHGKDAETYSCADCHEEEQKELDKSVHGSKARPGLPVSCVKCHNAHEALPASDRASSVHPLNIPRTCGQCHFSADPAGMTVKQLLQEKYTDDTHGSGLLLSGLTVAATCSSCHGSHSIRPEGDPESKLAPKNIASTCGECHVGVVERWSKSVHAQHQTDPEKRGATCVDCHRPHEIAKPDAHFKLGIIETCSGCHGKRGNTYRGTYHGRVSAIGYGGVASCDDCHTAHDILPSKDPLSSVHDGNRVETCAACHEKATASFAGYYVHADPHDREGYPVLYWAQTLMRWLILGTWAIWGVHTLLWLARALKEHQRLKAHAVPLSGRWYRRWPWSYRAMHIVLASSFLLLAATGLPLRFNDAPWSKVLYAIFGGAVNVQWLHRFGATLTFGCAFVFLVMIVARRIRGERGFLTGPNTLLPTRRDASDIRAHLRWFFRGGEQPRFDRWTYWEKFDFLAEVWGIGFIGITGLIMWFPIASTRFLPGWAINLAHILHSYEALLATSFIFTMHFFNANLRPGKFPVDPVFLTGRISEEELKHERPAEYERMKRDGRLDEELMPPPNDRQLRRARVVGITMMSVGFLLLAAMVSSLVF